MAMPQVLQTDSGKTGAANQSVEQFREAIRMDQRTVLSDEDMTVCSFLLELVFFEP
jgi:hypothetical protein